MHSVKIAIAATAMLIGFNSIVLSQSPYNSGASQTERFQVDTYAPPPPGTIFVFNVSDNGTYPRRDTLTVLDDTTPFQGVPTLRISDGSEITVFDRVTGSRIATLQLSGSPKYSMSPDSGNFVWPLWVGKSWSSHPSYIDHTRNRSWNSIGTHFSVSAYESVTVPAGTFKAFRIEYSPGEHNATRATVWFAPDIGYLVKRNFERTSDHYRGAQKTESELIEYRPAQDTKKAAN